MRNLRTRLMALEAIQRYNHHPRVRQQSVAAHTGNVAIITSVLCAAWDLPAFPALHQAVWHDYTEAITGDVSPLVKRYADWAPVEKRAALEAALYRTGEPPAPFALEPRWDGADTDEAMLPVVKLADYLDAWMFAQAEVELGNGLFCDIRDELNLIVYRALSKVFTHTGMPDGLRTLEQLFGYNFATAPQRTVEKEMSHV